MSQALMAIDESAVKHSKQDRRRKYFLSDTDYNLIRAVYGNPAYGSLSESIDYLAERFHAPRPTIREWASNMGLVRSRDDYWSDEDIAYLEEHYQSTGPRSSIKSIARRLGRTERAVQLKAGRLQYHRPVRGNYTASILANALGCSDRTVRRWIEQGMLVAKWQKASEEWDIDPKDIRQFIDLYPRAVDPRRFNWLWVKNILVGERSRGL